MIRDAREVGTKRPRVVIVGAGFGGLSAATALAKAPVDVILVDRRNYHLFQPLLYQVATAGLSPSDIAAPIRSIVRRQANATALLAKVHGIDLAARRVLTDGPALAFDYLILATGARHAYFGHDAWEPFAPGLKKIEDATEIRRRILLAFERAEVAADPAAQHAQLTFAVIGGGPTGVELAGAIAELARRALAADFRCIDPGTARILLVEAGPRVLPTFPDALSAKAASALQKLGVEVMTGTPVEACDADGIVVGGERIAAPTILWAAGVAASPAAKWLGAEKDRAGRIRVNPDLSVPGQPDVFAIGDTAALVDAAGKPVPGVAPAAKQQGRYVANLVLARLQRRPVPAPFRYHDAGNLATIGRKAAVADFGAIRLSGVIAWWLWGAAHVFFLIGFRNRIVVVLNWLWAYVTFQRGARLITSGSPE